MIKVLIVDDQNLTHKLIETYLKSESDIEIIGFAHNGQEAIEKIPELQPNVILMDVEMPHMDGLTATKIITKEFPQTKVLILTVHDNEQHLSEALQNGAKGYLLKSATPQELKTAIYNAYQGYFQLSGELTEKYLQKIIITKSEFAEISQVKRQLNHLEQAFHQLQANIKQNLDANSEQQVADKIEDLIKQEMSLLRDRDSHLQFKVDRMKYNQQRLEKNVNYMFKVQIGTIVLALLSIVYSAFVNFN